MCAFAVKCRGRRVDRHMRSADSSCMHIPGIPSRVTRATLRLSFIALAVTMLTSCGSQSPKNAASYGKLPTYPWATVIGRPNPACATQALAINKCFSTETVPGTGWTVTNQNQIASLPPAVASAVKAAETVEAIYVHEAWTGPLANLQGVPAKQIPPAHLAAAAWVSLVAAPLRYEWVTPSIYTQPLTSNTPFVSLVHQLAFDVRVFDFQGVNGWLDSRPQVKVAAVKSLYGPIPAKGALQPAMPLYVEGSATDPQAVFVPFAVVFATTGFPANQVYSTAGWTEMERIANGTYIVSPNLWLQAGTGDAGELATEIHCPGNIAKTLTISTSYSATAAEVAAVECAGS